MNILSLFCDIDDFRRLFEPARRRRLLSSGAVRRRKPGALSVSEVMTILVFFHASGYRDLRSFYTRHRSLWNFLGNVAAGLIAYTWREKKPSLNIQVKEQFLISN